MPTATTTAHPPIVPMAEWQAAHAALLARDGDYAALWRRQVREA